MKDKTFFIDLTKCTACRGCQVACKQWKKLPAEKTVNWGSHQNPKDLSGITLKVVRMNEVMVDDKLEWLFFPEQCRHCIDPPCAASAEVPGSIVHDEATGAVVFTELTRKENFQNIRESCPYDIPRQVEETGCITKCDMCIDRVRAGMIPACVQTCPTGTMNFGDRDDMLKLAEETLAKVQDKYPDAELVDYEDVRVIYLISTDGESYHEYLMADASPARSNGMSRKQMLARLGRPVKAVMSG